MLRLGDFGKYESGSMAMGESGWRWVEKEVTFAGRDLLNLNISLCSRKD